MAMSKKTVKNQEYSLSEEGFEFLRSLEIWRHVPKLDGSGQWTVGLRHTGEDVEPEREYTDEEILQMFDDDRQFYEDDVRSIFDPRFMTQHMFDACFCFAFQVGGISGTELGKMIQKNPYDDRIRNFWKYTYTQGKKNKALVLRRIKEVNYYFS
jgi:GH24 family phage-related lysozyme (muramidase)